MLSRLLAAFLLCASLQAATITITDTLYDSAGVATTMDGTLFISNEAFISADGDYISAARRSVTITDGALSISLETTAGSLNPTSTFYTVEYQITGQRSWTEFWTVPASGPKTINDLVVFTAPTPSLVVQLSQLAQTSAADGECQVWSDTNSTWEPGACATGSGIDCSSPIAVTLATGSVTISSDACYSIDTEGAASSDDWSAVVCAQGRRFMVAPASGARTVVVKQALGINSDFTLDNANDLFFGYCSTANTVREISRTSGGS